MRVQSAIAKGKELENFIVERLRLTNLDTRAYRQKGSGNGLNKGDVWNALNIHFECKNQKQTSFKDWFKQAEDENVSNFPIAIIWHLPQTPLENSKVIIDLYWFEELLKKWKNPTTISNQDREFKYLLENLKQIINQLLKKIE